MSDRQKPARTGRTVKSLKPAVRAFYDAAANVRDPTASPDDLNLSILRGTPHLEGIVLLSHRLKPVQPLPFHQEIHQCSHPRREVAILWIHHNCIRFVLPSTGRGQDWKFQRDGKRFSVAVSGNLALDHAEALVESAMAGTALIQISSFMTAPAIRRGDLKAVLTRFQVESPAIWVGREATVAFLESRQWRLPIPDTGRQIKLRLLQIMSQ